MIVGKIKGRVQIKDVFFDLDQPLTMEDLRMSDSEIPSLVGDGKAKVSVSVGIADKDFGSGFDAHVSISLTCNQDSITICRAYDAAADVLDDLMDDAKARAEDIWRTHVDRKKKRT